MTTQKTFKRSVRARAAKTGESYTTARAQLLRRSDAPASGAESGAPATEAIAPPLPSTVELAGVSDDAMLRGSGRHIGEWLELLDAWGATERSHTEIARWLRDDQGVPGWWSQTVTVAYERARGMRAVHEQTSGFAVGATRTIAAAADRCLEAFTDAATRRRWLPDAPALAPRRTTAAHTARFDWAEPPSRLVVWAMPRPDGRTTVSISHEKLADAEAAATMKHMWRDRLGILRKLLEA